MEPTLSRLVVVGGGVIGTCLAVAALDRGHEVVQLEREAEPRGASVRNFGLVWVCGRAGGRELELALAGREGWEALAGRAPAIGFRATGCLLAVLAPEELALAEAACARPDAAERGFRMLSRDEACALEPGLAGALLGALHSPLDALVEPRVALPALRTLAERSGRYCFLPGRSVLGLDGACAVDHTGERHHGDAVALCTGGALELLPRRRVEEAGLRVRNLQMLETEPLEDGLRVALADGDALRYYPAFDLPERNLLPPPSAAVARWATQLLVAPRANGALTIGDTHTDDEPGAFGVDEEPYEHLTSRAAVLLRRPLPRIARRWMGSYLRRTDGADAVLAEVVEPGVLVLTGAGGMGMTAAPALAAEALELLAW